MLYLGSDESRALSAHGTTSYEGLGTTYAYEGLGTIPECYMRHSTTLYGQQS